MKVYYEVMIVETRWTLASDAFRTGYVGDPHFIHGDAVSLHFNLLLR